MPGYISELDYFGHSNAEFIEVAVPAGTDVSGYSVVIYDDDGDVTGTFGLGTIQNTMSGQDVYVVDDNTPGYSTPDYGGNLYIGSAVALVDDSGNVLQFVSYWGETVEAQEGPAAKMTSVDIGTAPFGGSLISEDGGASYTAIETPTKGSIPACYAAGTLITTQFGPRPVEDLRVGDIILSPTSGPQRICWVWSGTQPLDELRKDQKPVLIAKGALGKGLPNSDMIVSAQHRIVIGFGDQVPDIFPGPVMGSVMGSVMGPVMVPAKALTALPGIRHMNGKKSIRWFHFACDVHVVVLANGAASESLLPGPMVLGGLDGKKRRELLFALAHESGNTQAQDTALPCLSVSEATRALEYRNPFGSAMPCGQTNAGQSHANLTTVP